MRKNVINVWVLVVILVLSMAGCSNTPIATLEPTSTDENEVCKLEFEARGTYILEAFGQEYFIYRFGIPNENIVVFRTVDGIYLVGENSGNKGISYGNIFMPDNEFIALSNEYFLFENEEGKVAIALEKKKNVKIGESFYKIFPFDELSDEEKNAFVYPIECEKEEKSRH